MQKNVAWVLSKKQRKASKSIEKDITTFLKKKKTMNVNMLVNSLEIFLKKRKTKSFTSFKFSYRQLMIPVITNC